MPYPVNIGNFIWFYRCDCYAAGHGCSITDICPKSSKTQGTDSSWLLQHCAPMSAPLGQAANGSARRQSRVLPKIWMSDHNQPACSASSREAVIGVNLKAASKPMWRSWPNPEFHLAPFGMWLYPRPLPTCLANNTWIEVIRIRETYEVRKDGTWYYHAPGSGVWLNTGRSVCVANVQRDTRHHPDDPAYAADPSRLAARGFPAGVGIDSRLKGPSGHAMSELDTLQRNGPIGNLLEIVDVRHEAAQRCGSQGCTCTGTLRAGWNASRTCRCSEESMLLQCR